MRENDEEHDTGDVAVPRQVSATFRERFNSLVRQVHRGKTVEPAWEPEPERKREPEDESSSEPVIATKPAAPLVTDDPVLDPVRALRHLLGTRAGLAPDVIERLRGETQAEVEEDIATLKRIFGSALDSDKPPAASLDGGAHGSYVEPEDMNTIVRRSAGKYVA